MFNSLGGGVGWWVATFVVNGRMNNSFVQGLYSSARTGFHAHSAQGYRRTRLPSVALKWPPGVPCEVLHLQGGEAGKQGAGWDGDEGCTWSFGCRHEIRLLDYYRSIYTDIL